MESAALALILAVLGQAQAGQPTNSMSAQDVIQLLEAAHAGIKDFSCEYEGQEVYLTKADADSLPAGSNGVTEVYSGQFFYRSDGKTLARIYHKASGIIDNRGRLRGKGLFEESILSDGRQVELYSRSDDAPTGGSLVRAAGLVDFDQTGSYGRIYELGTFLSHLKYPKKSLVHEGVERVGDATCERYAIVMGKEPYDLHSPDAMVKRYWVDLARNGHVLKSEFFIEGRCKARISGVVLERLGGPPDSGIWMPVEGICEGLDPSTGKPDVRQTYKVLNGSIRLNKGIGNSRFTVKHRPGDAITDQVKGMAYQVGQDTRPPPETIAQAQERLEETLRKAEADRSELRARSWSRGGEIDWSLWGPLAGFVIATPPLAILWIKRRRERS